MSFTITFMPDRISVAAAPGENLLDVAARAGLHINASCGGEGVCGRCRVELLHGRLNSEPGLYLSQEEYDQGLRLACRAQVVADAAIEIPLSSRADASLFTRQTAAAEEEVLADTLDPMYKPLVIKMTPPSKDDNRSDLDRLLHCLRTKHGLVEPDMELSALRHLPEFLRTTDYEIAVSTFIEPPLEEGGSTKCRILKIRRPAWKQRHFALAVDIGTTTVWGRLVDLETGRSNLAFGDLNGQISFGEDVISRIVYAGREGGLKRLQEKVATNLNNIITRLEEAQPGCRRRIGLVTVAGNTTMSHLFMGVDPKPIRLAPYVPVAATWPAMRAAEVGLELEPETMLLNFPSVSSYVGGDIVSGVLAAGLYKRPELTLFIDVGTNGEIVVGNQDWMSCAACSAGPAFEGGGVKFGMRAAPGAIDEFRYYPDRGGHRLSVIDGQKPLGICGSGLINIVAELFQAGLIDPQGKLVQAKAPHLIRTGDDGQEYLLSPAVQNAIDQDLVLTEIDIDNLIRAKGAMFSGYLTLLESVGLSLGDLERVIIAGGFGRSLNIKNAITIGLLPELPVERFSYIGNSSLTGATLVSLSGALWQDAARIKNSMTNFELSETPGYMDYYVASQFLPHTRQDLFPQTMAALGRS